MVTYVRDQTGRFLQRPHYKPEELDRECESVITGFLKDLYGEVRYPVDTEDLKKLIERDAEDLDVYACWRRPNLHPPRRLNLDPGSEAGRGAVGCG